MIITLAGSLDDITANAFADLKALANSPEFSLVFQDAQTPIGTATNVILKDNTSGADRQEELLAYLPDANGNPVEKTVIRQDYALILSAVYDCLARTGFAKPPYRLEFPDLEERSRQDDGASPLHFESPFIH
jgi:hypothetical protein